MKIRNMCACMVMASGILLFTGEAGQAQPGAETPPGGTANGPGIPGGSRGGSMGSMNQDRESSGSMGQEGSDMSHPLPGGNSTLREPGNMPDSSGSNPTRGGSKSSSGSGSAGSMGSSGGMGSGGMGSSGGAGGGGR